MSKVVEAAPQKLFVTRTETAMEEAARSLCHDAPWLQGTNPAKVHSSIRFRNVICSLKRFEEPEFAS